MTTFQRARTAILLAATAALGADRALASCGATVCPYESPALESRDPGTWVFEISYLHVDQSRARIGTRGASPGEISGHHDEILTQSKITTLRVGTNVTRRFGIDVSIPFVQREHEHLHNHHHHGEHGHEGEVEVIPFRADVSGLGDVEALGRVELLAPAEKGLRLAVLLGGSLPTGADDEEGVSTSEEGRTRELAEVGIQPGAGTYSLIAGLTAHRRMDATTLTGETGTLALVGSTSFRSYGRSREDYRLGNSWHANAGVVYPALPKVGVSAQLNARHAGRDDAGETHEEVEKTGGTWVYATPGLQVAVGKGFVAFLDVQVPVYQDVNSIQLVSPYNVGLGVAYRFDAD